MIQKHLIAFLSSVGLAFAASLIATPLAMAAARRWGILDRPNTALKNHEKPIPYLGGVALFASFSVALFSIKYLFFPHASGLWPGALDVFKGIYSIFVGALFSMVLGVIDDVKVLSPKLKFLGQILAALLLVACGIHIRFVRETWLSIPLTVFWVVAISNALNFVDIMDGLAAGVSAIGAFVFFLFSSHAGRTDDSIAALALLGSCLGFLVFNFAPARVYMGDAGSIFLGFTLSAIAMNERFSHQNTLAVFSPLLILALPIFDVLLMTVIRIRRGIPPWKGSPDHIPLRLRVLGFSKVQTVLILYGSTLCLGLLAYLISFLSEAHALLAWSLTGFLAVALGAWFMSIRMPYEK